MAIPTETRQESTSILASYLCCGEAFKMKQEKKIHHCQKAFQISNQGLGTLPSLLAG